MSRCRRCGRGGLDEDERHCQPCKDELDFWADIFEERLQYLEGDTDGMIEGYNDA